MPNSLRLLLNQMTLPDSELSLIALRFNNKDLNSSSSCAVQLILQGNYLEVISSEFAKKILHSQQYISSNLDINDLLDSLFQRASKLLNEGQDPQFQQDLLCIGVALLLLFIQDNWTGPPITQGESDFFTEGLSPDQYKYLQESSLNWLKSDNEEPYVLTSKPFFLVLAKYILVQVVPQLCRDVKTSCWWAWRSLFTQQRLLQNGSSTLLNTSLELIDKTEAFLALSKDCHRDIKVRFYLEKGVMHHWYRQDKKAKANFEKAQEESRFNFTVTGLLGKKTKFQDHYVSQLTIQAKSNKESSNMDIVEEKPQPKNLLHNDDTLHETIQFAKESNENDSLELEKGNLKIEDQCILLAFCLNIKNTNPVDGLTTEQMYPYVQRVLENPNNWMVYTMALLLRSRLEGEKTRTVERSALQLQALVDQFPVEDSDVKERMAHFFSISLPSKWEMEKELAHRLMSLGVILSALEIFERLHMWEDVILCHVMADKKDKAKEIIEKQIQQRPSYPLMYCLLGDIEKDPIYYEKAWEISGNRYSRAMRSLGWHYFNTGKYEKCIECYSNALAINPLHEQAWFTLACAATRIDNWEKALEGYSRCISLEDENGEAWNNIGSVYLKLGRKEDAMNAFKFALRFKYDNWQMWQNFMYVALDLGDYLSVIRSMDRIFEIVQDKENLQQHILDEEILCALSNAVRTGRMDFHGRSASECSSKYEALLTKLTSKVTNNITLWRHWALFWSWKEDSEKALEGYIRVYRSLLSKGEVYLCQEPFEICVDSIFELVDAYRNFGPKLKPGSNEVVLADWLYQAKMTVRTFLSRTRDSFENTTKFGELENLLEELKQESQ